MALIQAGSGMLTAPFDFLPMPSYPSASSPQNRFREGEELIAKCYRIIMATNEEVSRITCLNPVPQIRNLTAAEKHIVVTMKFVARPCCISKDANQSVIWNVIHRDRLQILLKAQKAARTISLRQRLVPQSLQPMDGKSSFLSSYSDKLHIRFNLLPLLNRSLSEGESPGVPNGKGGHDRLCPRGPLALGRAPRGQEPAAVVEWICHATSSVFSRAIVCGGNA